RSRMGRCELRDFLIGLSSELLSGGPVPVTMICPTHRSEQTIARAAGTIDKKEGSPQAAHACSGVPGYLGWIAAPGAGTKRSSAAMLMIKRTATKLRPR